MILNLKVGDPKYMVPYWDNQTIYDIKFKSPCFYPQDWDALRSEISKFHKNVQNINVNPNHIVWGNGASHLVSASIYAKTRGVKSAEIKIMPPYWRRIPELFKLGAVDCDINNTNTFTNLTVNFLVSPNNPDGVISDLDVIKKSDIIDYCYNWPQYTDNISQEMAEINIYGFSKAVGLAGLRFGWAIVKNDDLRLKIKEFTDCSTCGVSTIVQERVYATMNYINNLILNNKITPFQYAKEILEKRWNESIEAFKNHKIKISNPRQGMFLWLYITDGDNLPEILENKYGIICMTGKECGVDNSFARISLGCTEDEFNEFIKRIKNNSTSQT